MQYASYKILGTGLIPATVSVGDASSPVWHQAKWSEGEYQQFVQKNGCGHCCAAIALCLHGVDIDPHREFALCRTLWGEPVSEQDFLQGNHQSVAGITKILTHHGVAAAYFGVPSRKAAAKHIDQVLHEGKRVIFWTQPNEDFPETPFSFAAHYVMAVGYTEDGKILVANSSARKAPEGVQLTDAETVARALFLGVAPEDLTWGLRGRAKECAGYVVVG